MKYKKMKNLIPGDVWLNALGIQFKVVSVEMVPFNSDARAIQQVKIRDKMIKPRLYSKMEAPMVAMNHPADRRVAIL